MRWLARLKEQKVKNAQPTKTTESVFVVSIGTPVDPVQEIETLEVEAKSHKVPITLPTKTIETLMAVSVGSVPVSAEATTAYPSAANDSCPDPDRWCWPHSTAMTGAEIDTFMARLSRFAAKGFTHDAGEALADKLVIRDRDSDDRRSCLECSNLAGSGSWRCRNWRQADVAFRANDAALPADLVNLLQRCHGFSTGFDIRDIDLLLGSDALQ